MATATIDLTLWGQQHDFVFSDVKNIALLGGVGSGKSYAGAMRGILAALGQVGDKQVPTPNVGVVTAPTYKMLKDATMRTYFEILRPMNLMKDFNKSDHIVTLTNGSEIIFRSASDHEILRGPSILWWDGDEAALYGPSVWLIMIARLRQYGIRGWAWLPTTPKGRNWIWQQFERDGGDDYKYWRLRTADNPFIAAEYYDSLKDAYTGDFAAQELNGEFVAFEGLIYPEFTRGHHIARIDPQRIVSTVAGVDWGFVHPGVIEVVGTDSDGRAAVVSEQYQRQRRVEEWVEVAKQMRSTWHIGTFYCDPSEPDYINAFRDAGLNAQAADNSVNPGIQAVKNRLVIQPDGKPRLTIDPDAVWLISEFESYQWAENRYGMRDQPVKANDHAIDALRYAIMGLDKGMKPITAKTQAWA